MEMEFEAGQVHLNKTNLKLAIQEGGGYRVKKKQKTKKEHQEHRTQNTKTGVGV